MDFRLAPEVERFRDELRAFLVEHLTPEVQADRTREWVGPASREFLKLMGERGYLGVSWPAEYGGRGLPLIYECVLNEELAYHLGPQIISQVGLVGPVLIAHGSEWQKREFLPRIIHDGLDFAVGYSEPGVGSDLAGLTTSAALDGDDYVVNGRKRFCSGAHYSPYIWTAVRTDSNLPKHRGISVLLIDSASPGISVREMKTMGLIRTNEVTFRDVRVPRRYLVGEPNQGWYLLAEALDQERFFAFPYRLLERSFDHLVEWVRTARRDGRPLAEDPLVRHQLARLATELEAVRMLSVRSIATALKNEPASAEASMIKLRGSQMAQQIADVALDLMGPAGLQRMDTPFALINGEHELAYRYNMVLTLGGGTSEIQKNIIARRGLRLPA